MTNRKRVIREGKERRAGVNEGPDHPKPKRTPPSQNVSGERVARDFRAAGQKDAKAHALSIILDYDFNGLNPEQEGIRKHLADRIEAEVVETGE